MKRTLIMTIGIICLCACTNVKNEKAIVSFDVSFGKNADTMNYSTMIDSVRYIELDSCNSVGRIDEVRVYDNLFYLCDKHESSISLYDKDGGFVRKIRRKGRAKEEYCSITDFDVSMESGEIHIWDDVSRKFIIYSCTGEYKRSFSCDNICRDFAVLKNGDYLVYKPDYCEGLLRGLWLTDSLGNFKKQLLEIDSKLKCCPVLPMYMSRYGNDIIGLLGTDDNDNIYSYSDNELNVNFHINFEKQNPSDFNSQAQPDFSKYAGQVHSKVQYFENKRWLYLVSTDLKQTEVSIYDKSQSLHYQLAQQDIVNDVNLYAQIVFMNDESMVGFVESQFVEAIPYLKAKFPNHKENANPILVVAKLK